jgi:hypothetical protein
MLHQGDRCYDRVLAQAKAIILYLMTNENLDGSLDERIHDFGNWISRGIPEEEEGDPYFVRIRFCEPVVKLEAALATFRGSFECSIRDSDRQAEMRR